MKSILKPASRLIVIFILTMIISGGILTYLSINSISTFRELTEKKVAEEQLSVTDHLVEMFQKELEEFTDCLDWDAIKHSDSIEFVENPFIVNADGEFLWPWFMAELKQGIEPQSGPLFRNNYETAQRIEFQEKEYQAAALYYRRSLAHAFTREDSAKSLNAMGRVNLKMQAFAAAYSNYSRITSDYASILDNSGFPYIYYAILNLIEISNSNHAIQAISEIGAFLEGIIRGNVPMNCSTSDILVRITAVISDSGMEDMTMSTEWSKIIKRIDENLRFINNYGDDIKSSLLNWKNGEPQLQLGSILVIRDPSVDPGSIVLINSGKEHPPGFRIDLDQIWPGFLSAGYPEQTEFEYTICLVESLGNSIHGNDRLVTSARFSPYFPEHEIRIELQDEKMIDNLVTRRSWTYGIALFLLLGAMLMGILLILRDILREKRLSQLRSGFVSNVTHDLKTPLTSIHLFAESVLLDRVDTESGKKEYLQVILRETERLKRMISNILDFSKHEQGKIEYVSEKVNVTVLVQSALKELNYWLEEMNFTVHADIEEGVHISGDHDAIKQVVINLLDNAIKYSRSQKEIRIKLALEEDKIRMEFSDKGIGIPGDQLDAIFEKFYRVNDTMVDGLGGTGLGLTVVKEIIEAHRGEITVESVLNKGSTFTVLLNPI